MFGTINKAVSRQYRKVFSISDKVSSYGMHAVSIKVIFFPERLGVIVFIEKVRCRSHKRKHRRFKIVLVKR
jgi:hypothetical protein